MTQTTLPPERRPSDQAGEFSDHLERLLTRPGYRDDLNRRVRASMVGAGFGLIGLIVSASVLLTATLVPPADAFWLLCLILSAAVFGVAQATLVGALLSHLALQRFAVGRQDLEMFEAMHEFESLHASIKALNQLAQAQTRGREAVNASLIVETVAYISAAADMMGETPANPRRDQVVRGWKAAGADEGVLARLTMQGSISI